VTWAGGLRFLFKMTLKSARALAASIVAALAPVLPPGFGHWMWSMSYPHLMHVWG